MIRPKTVSGITQRRKPQLWPNQDVSLKQSRSCSKQSKLPHQTNTPFLAAYCRSSNCSNHGDTRSNSTKQPAPPLPASLQRQVVLGNISRISFCLTLGRRPGFHSPICNHGLKVRKLRELDQFNPLTKRIIRKHFVRGKIRLRQIHFKTGNRSRIRRQYPKRFSSNRW